MSINVLPDDCWLTIFDNLNSLDDIINASKVCSKWESLITRRCGKIKCLKAIATEDDPKNSVYFGTSYGLNALELNKLLPNLQTLQINPKDYGLKVQCFIDEIAPSYPSIKRLIFTGHLRDLSSILRFPNIEMVACRKCNLASRKEAHHLNKLTQLHVNSSESLLTTLKSFSNAKYNFLNNLQRLQVANYFIPFIESNSFNGGFTLKNLKILELSSTCEMHSKPDVFSFMDYCPSLESAYLSVTSVRYSVYFNPSIIHTKLRDLVIEKVCGPQFKALSFNWNPIHEFLKKCPNLKHLAIRNSIEITDDIVKELVNVVPQIEILDLRRCKNVTNESAVYVRNFARRSGRSIDFNYGQDFRLRQTKLTFLSEESSQKLCYSFDFMKHCFFRTFDQLPVLMIP